MDRFLLVDTEKLKSSVDFNGELTVEVDINLIQRISTDQILNCLDGECTEEVENYAGFYFLKGRKNIVASRLNNYFYGIKREKIIRRYAKGLKYIPFVRGAALAGSQAMGQQSKLRI